MRLLISLSAESTFPYDLGYHHNLQGFIYRLISQAGYESLHDQKGCKFFSFSNIIPPSRIIQRGSTKSLVVASPNRDLIRSMQDEAEKLEGTPIKIGKMTFRMEDSKVLDIKIPDGFQDCTLTTGTPIIVRIPRRRFLEYGIKPVRDYGYVYWRKEYTPTAFVKQLEENLVKKYNKYYSAEVVPFPIIEKIGFRKQVAVPLQMQGAETTVIGTLWKFVFASPHNVTRNILQFGLNAGFGEMNSLGFGFMNLTKGDTYGGEPV